MTRRSFTAALASIALGVAVAVLPAASASAAANGAISVYNNCGQTTSYVYYRSGSLAGGGTLPAGAHSTISVAPGTYVVTSSPRYTTVTVRSGQGWAVRLCNN